LGRRFDGSVTYTRVACKASDINRDLLATQLVNSEPPNLSLAERKKDAAHLIDQVFIREEIRVGDYPAATAEQASKEVDQLIKERYKSKSDFEAALKKYQLSEPDLLEQFRWQLTVLAFIDARFRPAVLINDEEIQKYYQQHLTQLKKQNPKGSEANLKSDAREILTDDAVNKLLFDWLDQHRQNAKITYLERALQ
jgi:polyhydroxyalkanoate synthesis regulator phasin